jgi:E3 ubiquitin-protein ligase RNF213
LPVLVFDEIGLAELSRHNPLKVLHNKLEIENRKIGFVGISNWRLDASKMNRALYLARPDPDEDDLIFTAKCIFNQICKK